MFQNRQKPQGRKHDCNPTCSNTSRTTRLPWMSCPNYASMSTCSRIKNTARNKRGSASEKNVASVWLFLKFGRFGAFSTQFEKNQRCARRKKKLSRVDIIKPLESIQFFPGCSCITQAWNCIRLFRARCCWSRAGPVKKCHFHCQNMPGTTSGTAVQIVRGLGRKPGSESIRRVSIWSSSKNQTRDLSGGLRGLQTGSESIAHAFAWSSSPNLNPETIC